MKIAPGTPIVVSLRWCDDHVMRVGRLAMRDRQVFFQYDEAFTRSALPISPFQLPLGERVFGPFAAPFEGLPGVFNDSLPDGWGRLLVDRRARKLNVALTPLDRLAVVGENGIGALVYAPRLELEETQGALDLDALAADTTAVLDGAADDVLDRLIVLGGSPQGARPKAMIAWSEADGRIIRRPQSGTRISTFSRQVRGPQRPQGYRVDRVRLLGHGARSRRASAGRPLVSKPRRVPLFRDRAL